ncbi:MAG: UDP-4-amino-4,6-dideoxy-N-acetyl-beta-L-altrosamine transaminase [Deltaproteobacteria bacterium]|nr:UDP-4-amino-4,6-dideoxy-N-acetyl-beta-L-altrosamine transaminase [Deltaproteobacteria bacterium]
MARAKLALDGGTPVRQRVLSYGRQTIERADEQAVIAALRSDFLTQGPRVDEFERRFAEYVGRRYAVAFANGTAALHGAYEAAGVGPGRDLVTSPLTFCATANAALFLGAGVRFADVDADSALVDPASVEKTITRKTRAICAIHYGGMLADMPALSRLAKKYGVVLIEDACHALGATGYGKQAGCFGDLGVFSFHPVKPITTAEGGMVVTNNKSFAEKMRRFRTHGIVKGTRRSEPWFHEMRDLGFNYRLSDLHAALGLSQLARYDDFLAKRRRIATFYDKVIAKMPGITACPVPAETSSAYHLYPILVSPERFRGGRGAVFRALQAEGIGVQVHYVPANAHPYYRRLGYDPRAAPHARRFYEREISLPIFPSMTARDRRDVVDALAKVHAGLSR